MQAILALASENGIALYIHSLIGVPHQVVGVYGAFAVATTAVLAQVGGEGDRQRQATGERHAIRKIEGVDGLKVVAVACAVAP